MSEKQINRTILLGAICGLLASVPVSTEFSAHAQDVDSPTQETEQENVEQENAGGSAQAGNETKDAEQKALEAEIVAVEKVLETGNKNDVEQVLSEFETDKPLPADVALPLPSDI